MNFLISLLLQQPYNLVRYTFKLLALKTTLNISSLPGPKKGYKFAGKTADCFTAILPSMGDLRFGISFFSLGDTLKIGMVSD
jgi:hypothetical protein